MSQLSKMARSPLDLLPLFPSAMLREFFGDVDRSRDAFLPAMDVHENSDGLEITVELPGMTADDVQVNYADGILTVSGEKHNEKTERNAEGEKIQWHRTERHYGRFSRSITIPQTFNVDHINASFKEGVLTLSIAKRPESKARKIEIKGL